MSKHTIASWPSHIDIRHEKNDGAACVHSMTWDEYAEFYEIAKQVRLTTIGVEELTVRAEELQHGDVFESLGVAVDSATTIEDITTVRCKNGTGIVLQHMQLVRVNRIIQ